MKYVVKSAQDFEGEMVSTVEITNDAKFVQYLFDLAKFRTRTMEYRLGSTHVDGDTMTVEIVRFNKKADSKKADNKENE